MTSKELKLFLDKKVVQYQQPSFIESDPIQIPHQFSKKEDIEIAGFLVATIAWGTRTIILKNGKSLMERMDNSPYDYVMNHSSSDLKSLKSFVHRTFNEEDAIYFVKSLNNIYKKHNGLEVVLRPQTTENNYKNTISRFKKIFFSLDHQYRTEKHISDPNKNSAAKRIHMFLRWMVRDSKEGVDLGIWKSHNSKHLSCPLDVHSGRVARKLNLLTRKQNDWKAVVELDQNLRKMDKNDPAKYDFALFGLGVFETF